LLFLFSVQIQGQEIQSLDTETFAFALRHDPTVQVIDLRNPEAFDEGHIKKAISAPYDNDNFQTLAQKNNSKRQDAFSVLPNGFRRKKRKHFPKGLRL